MNKLYVHFVVHVCDNELICLVEIIKLLTLNSHLMLLA